MANRWDDLTEEYRNMIVKQGLVGSANTPENANRLREQLANNPKLVERLSVEAGLFDPSDELDDTQPDEDMDQDNEGDIERTVNEAIDNDGNVQDTGELTSDIPPPQRGEAMEDYIARLMEATQSMDTENVDRMTGPDAEPYPVQKSLRARQRSNDQFSDEQNVAKAIGTGPVRRRQGR